jgi:biotin carboxylase
MILGAGSCQVPIIQQAQKMGFYTIAVSVNGNYPGFSAADKFYAIDLREKEEILKVARKEKICGILTDQTDIPVLTVGFVAEKLGLPGIGYDCSLRFTNKFQMRQYCEKINVPVPIHYNASTLTEACNHAMKVDFPIMVKPVDSQGSRGVSRIDNATELENKIIAALGYSACREVILEQFIPNGKEVVVEGFVSDYEFSNLVVGDRYYFDLPDVFIPKQTLFPSLLPESLQQKILEINHHLITNFAPKFGITHSEYIVNPVTGIIHLVETAIRGGGVFISSDLVPMACGVNVGELLIKCATGTPNVRISPYKKENNAAGYVCFYLPEGVIRRVEGIQKVMSLAGVKKAHLDDIKIGERIGPPRDKTMRLGPILVAGKDRTELHATIEQVQDSLKIDVETHSGNRGIEW